MTESIFSDYSDNQLKEAFDIDDLRLHLLKYVIEHDNPDLDLFKSVQQYVNQCYNEPNQLEKQMVAINELIDGYGIESSTIEGYWHSNYWQSTVCTYINQGDSYALTILYNVVDGQLELTTWGDFIESIENQLIDDGEIEKPINCD